MDCRSRRPPSALRPTCERAVDKSGTGAHFAKTGSRPRYPSRIVLLLGKQPSMIGVFGPHVRSFTLGEFVGFLPAGGMFELVEVRGVGF